MSSIIFVGELTIGHLYRSISLVSDSFHVLSDLISLLIGLYAVIVSSTDRTKQTKANNQYTYGYDRVPIIASIANGLFLLAFSVNIIAESLTRFIDPSPITEPTFVLYAGIIGCAGNLISFVFFHAHLHDDSHNEGGCSVESHRDMIYSCEHMARSRSLGDGFDNVTIATGRREKSSSYHNLYGVYLHVISDLLGSILVIFVATLKIFIKSPSIDYVDPALSLILSVMMIVAGGRQVRKSVPVLLQKTPSHISVSQIKKELLNKLSGEVHSIHDLHVWQFAGNTHIASMHVKLFRNSPVDETLKKIRKYMFDLGVYSVTLQPEIIQNDDNHLLDPDACFSQFKCSSHVASTCCPYIYSTQTDAI